MLDQIILGNSILSWLVAGAILVGSLVIGRIAAALLVSVVRRLGSAVLVAVGEGARGPLTTLALVLGVRVAVESLALPQGLKDLSEKSTTFIAVVVLTWLLAKCYDALHSAVFLPYARRPTAAIDVHLFGVLRTVCNILIWVIGLASALNSVGFEVSAILAGLGIGGMALALAAQDSVANLFGGVIVLTSRPFKIGDRIEVAGVNGWVQQINLRSTLITNWYGRQVTVPNKCFTDSIVTNIDTQNVYFQEARLRLDPRTPAAGVDQALQILREIVADLDELDKTPWVMFDRIDHGFFELEFWYGIPRWSKAESASIPNEYEKICRAKSKVNLEILKRFEAAGLQLAVPMEIHLGSGGPPRAPSRTPPTETA